MKIKNENRKRFLNSKSKRSFSSESSSPPCEEGSDKAKLLHTNFHILENYQSMTHNDSSPKLFLLIDIEPLHKNLTTMRNWSKWRVQRKRLKNEPPRRPRPKPRPQPAPMPKAGPTLPNWSDFTTGSFHSKLLSSSPFIFLCWYVSLSLSVFNFFLSLSLWQKRGRVLYYAKC